MKKAVVLLVLGLLCLVVGFLLAYGLQHVTENYSWYLGYMAAAFIVGLWTTHISIRRLRKR